MESNFFNRTMQELENEANEELSKMNREEIEDRANRSKKSSIRDMTILGIISAILFTVILCCIPLRPDGEPIEPGIVVFGIICGVCTTAFPFILLLFVVKKAPEELVLQQLKKELRPDVLKKIREEQQMKYMTDPNFIISKSVSILASGWSSTNLLIDNQNKKFNYQKGKVYSKSYSFSDIINYEVYENGKSQVEGRAGSALIGGAFFGLGGLIVGSSMSRNINEKCNQLKLIIRLNDFNYPQIVITYVDNVDWDKSGWVYRNMKENIQAVCSMLEYMLNEKTLEQSSSVKQEEKPIEQKSAKEQLQELKEMLDDGLITQEDFEQKKKQILGL